MTFARLLSESTASTGLPATGDVLAIGLPFLRQLDDLHLEGRVTRLSGVGGVNYDGDMLRLDAGFTQEARRNERVVRRLNPEVTASGIDVAKRLGIDHGTGASRVTTSLDVFDGAAGDAPDRPMFVVGYRAWEQLHGHHDALTDIHLAGLLLVSYATGLDFDVDEFLHDLAFRHHHLTQLNAGLHPVVAGVLSEMISPDRHRRPTDLGQVIARLEHHRDLPTDLDLTDAYVEAGGWRRAVLSTLRERVFDLSRRNKALYFKPSATALSLTEASVPLLLNVERIQPGDLLTWTGVGAEAFRSGKRVDLERWCRFEEAPHLAPGLDKLITNERKLRAEHGQGRLRLIVAFLRWADPDTGEMINSPLITMPAELDRKKGLRDRYRVRIDDEGEISPVLRHVFRSRFGIPLPEVVETDNASIVALVDQLQAAVSATDQSVRIDLIDTPRVNIIRRRAQLRVDAYLKRRAQAQASTGRWRRQDHSYDHDDWRPLGLALYERFVRPAELPLRSLAGAAPRPRRPDALSAAAEVTSAGERVQSQYQVSAGEVSRHRWEVDLCSVTLASLGSRRTSLSRDYNMLLGNDGIDFSQMWESSPFDALFTPEPRAARSADVDPISVDQTLVLPADGAQAKAVRRGLAGESLIIQGPPGTGKSQTITNLIAAFVADGKRVLFVCEKRAALDVVAHRLRQVGLDRLVATIHDSQLDRKAFIGDLGETYEQWLADGDDDRADHRENALAGVNALLVPLERVFTELHDARGGRRSLAELVERLVQLRLRGVEPRDSTRTESLEPGPWLDARPVLDRVAEGSAAAGWPGPLGRHAALRVAPSQLDGVDPIVASRSVGETLAGAVRSFAEVAGPATPLDDVLVGSLPALALNAPILSALAERNAVAVLDRQSGAHLDARAAATANEQLRSDAEAATAVLERWRNPLSADDTRAALETARANERSPLRFLSSKWRKVNSIVKAEYRFELHQIEPATSQVLADLAVLHDANDALTRHADQLRTAYGTDDVRSLLTFADGAADDPVVRALITDAGAVDTARLAEAGQALVDAVGLVMVDNDATCADLARIGEAMSRASVADERALVAWAGLVDTPSDVLLAALDEEATLDEIERAVLDGALDRAGASGAVGSMTGAQLDSTVEQLLERYRELLRANAELVASQAAQRFRAHVAFSEASMAGRSDDDKAFKRSYNAGRKLLEREFDKKMRYRSIRELAGGDSGAVVRDLKPVWLMSPLSVSDTLPLDDELFDVVIFDEASQIPVEDAVPTLFRARQAIVVGDRMQLPPTRFFSTGAEDDDDIVVEDEGHRITVTLDADSFLTQADLSLDSTMLTWHYRSRFESLIGYSNHAFYEARLATIPDRGHGLADLAPISVTSPDDAPTFLADALARPISFHRMEHGVYEDRRNDAEADYIAEMVRAMLVSQTGLTIGVVAFSEAQQTAIETSLAELAVLDKTFAALLEAEQTRTDDGEFVGLFVKNLENVQGDERDMIIMSVCYGAQPDGKMRMNFGPINQAGGERRLNVIFSRAKQHMAIVSSIDGRDITNTHNDGAAHLARFLDYAAAESTGGLGGDALLRALRPVGADDESNIGEPQHRSAVASEIAGRLAERGHVVDVGVGRSAFTIDVAIRGDDEYALGVMVDPGTADTTTTARLVAEAGVLSAFDWPMTRVFVSEWWANPDQVIDRIELLLP